MKNKTLIFIFIFLILTNTTVLYALKYGQDYVIKCPVCDCLYKMHNRNEDQSSDMKFIINKLEKFVSNDMAIVIVHHHNKSGDERGSSCLTDWVDTSLAIRKDKLYFNKTRGDAPLKPTKLDWSDDELMYKCTSQINSNAQKITDDILIILTE